MLSEKMKEDLVRGLRLIFGDDIQMIISVSYTHLTLPTKRIV